MKNHLNNSFLFTWMAVLALMLPNQIWAQTFMTLHSFSPRAGNPSANNDGADPYDSLILAGNTLYGTTCYGGTGGNGTVFCITTSGQNFTNLYNFTTFPASYSTNRDGANPYASLVLSGNILYGTTQDGGTWGKGTIFAINTNGAGFTNLYNFTDLGDGANPRASLIVSGGLLYGTAQYGGSLNYGTVFLVNTNGLGFTTLYTFTNGVDGAYPVSSLVLSANTLYGPTYYGGLHNFGTIFTFNLNSEVFTNIYTFTGGSDGSSPYANLILSDGTLYGTAHNGHGNPNKGDVFKLSTNGTLFTTIYGFTNNDGSNPYAGLTLSGSTLYGTTEQGGSASDGIVFAVDVSGSGYTNLYSFTNGTDGYNPQGGVVLSGNILYGTSDYGGSAENGTVYSFTLPVISLPQLTINRTGTNVILSWPTKAIGYALQSTTNLATPVWTTISGQYNVTNPILDTDEFYRLLPP